MTEEPKRKSAVEWIFEQIRKNTWYDEDGSAQITISTYDLEQAKKMDQDNIESAWAAGNLDWDGHANGRDYFEKTYTPQKPSGKLEFPE